MIGHKVFLALIVFLYSHLSLFAQSNFDLAVKYLHQKYPGLKTESEMSWLLTDEVFTRHNGVTHLYLRQVYQGIEIHNLNMNLAIKNGQIIHEVGQLTEKVKLSSQKSAKTQLKAEEAVMKVANQLNLKLNQSISTQKTIGGLAKQAILSSGGISNDPIPVKLVYWQTNEGDLRLAWDLSINDETQNNWWSIRVDAYTGEILERNDWVNKCQFDHIHNANAEKCSNEYNTDNQSITKKSIPKTTATGQYHVFSLPLESPNHGNRSMVSFPQVNANTTASPFGWHDTNGADGAEFTTTRGNNVSAYSDRDSKNPALGANANGTAPDGGANLVFDFPADLNATPADYLNAAITNLFYWSNINHDVFYQYGFDEKAGNFQFNNYNKGGTGNDAVRAEAQDGAGFNNANFSTPADGSAPRMQMFLWGSPRLLTINAPANLAGNYQAGTASFGAKLNEISPVVGDIKLVNDGSANPTLACNTLPVNSLSGKIALIDRGSCNFVIKVKKAQDAGAIAAIIVNNVANTIINMSGTDESITIPTISITQELGQSIKTALSNSITVNVKLSQFIDFAGEFEDGDFDNGIVTHEYGHGISNRLTGGPANSDCLVKNAADSTSEQMGEGWSDYFALMLTMKSGDVATKSRGIGTYAINQTTTGGGIRPFPYTTDINVNPATYESIKTLSIPHGVGFVWCTMLWDMTWKFIERYGYDPDIYKGTGGNNKALQLVIDGLKLQPCGPGFVDGRNAILKADFINNNGANFDIIWAAFARRGLGYNAKQGDAKNRADGTQDFTAPPTGTITALENPSEIGLIYYPNPSQGILNIAFKNEAQKAVKYCLYNPQGQIILEKNSAIDLADFKETLDVKAFPSGMYFLRVQVGEKSYMKKVILQ